MSNVAGILGLALRARKAAFGEQVLKSIQGQQAKLVVISDTCGNNTRKKLVDKCSFYHIPYIFIEDDIISQISGRWNRKSIAILDQGFADSIQGCLKG